MSKKVESYSFLFEAFERVSIKSKTGKAWEDLTKEEQEEITDEAYNKISSYSASWYIDESMSYENYEED